jgi:hypothetical protein
MEQLKWVQLLKGFAQKMAHAKARSWPRLTYVFQVHSTADFILPRHIAAADTDAGVWDSSSVVYGLYVVYRQVFKVP